MTIKRRHAIKQVNELEAKCKALDDRASLLRRRLHGSGFGALQVLLGSPSVRSIMCSFVVWLHSHRSQASTAARDQHATEADGSHIGDAELQRVADEANALRAANTELVQKGAAQDAELRSLQAEIAQARSELTTVRSAHDSAAQSAAQAETRAGELEQQLRGAKAEIEKLEGVSSAQQEEASTKYKMLEQQLLAEAEEAEKLQQLLEESKVQQERLQTEIADLKLAAAATAESAALAGAEIEAERNKHAAEPNRESEIGRLRDRLEEITNEKWKMEEERTTANTDELEDYNIKNAELAVSITRIGEQCHLCRA